MGWQQINSSLLYILDHHHLQVSSFTYLPVHSDLINFQYKHRVEVASLAAEPPHNNYLQEKFIEEFLGPHAYLALLAPISYRLPFLPIYSQR